MAWLASVVGDEGQFGVGRRVGGDQFPDDGVALELRVCGPFDRRH